MRRVAILARRIVRKHLFDAVKETAGTFSAVIIRYRGSCVLDQASNARNAFRVVP